MNPEWRYISRVASGGTVLGIEMNSKGELWSASSTGLFRNSSGRWLPVSRSMPLAQVSDILSVGNTLIAAGWPEGIIYSIDGGQSWYRAWIDQVKAPITCLTISPNYNRDRVLLAGTQGEGILRTTDGGRHWQLSNFGLRGFSVFALASIGVRQTFRELSVLKEIVFAGTDDGVYQSPNGGRAWRQAGEKTAGMTILALAISNNFSVDQTIFAGAESGILFRSRDRGTLWEETNLDSFNTGAINCLLYRANGDLWVGTSQAGILHSPDSGETWESILTNIPPVLTLELIDNRLYAGFHELGLMFSSDAGASWQPERELSARRFQWLDHLSDKEFVAAGAQEGIWVSPDRGLSWNIVSGWEFDRSALGISADKGVILAAAQDGVWRSTDFGSSWSLVIDKPLATSPFYFAQHEEFAWAGSASGELWYSRDQGQTWEKVRTPFSGANIVGLGFSKRNRNNRILVVGTAEERQAKVLLWMSTDMGQNWSIWHTLSGLMGGHNPGNLQMAIAGKQGSESILSLNTQIYCPGADGWLTNKITTEENPIQSLVVTPNSGIRIAALTDQVLFNREEDRWEPLGSTIQGQSVIALNISPQFEHDHTIFALTRDGQFWCCELKP
jgi:photosystem II stability/assembly factor-like uncharacterized protein